MLTTDSASKTDIHALMAEMGRRARAAAAPLAIAAPRAKHAALMAMADAIEADMGAILAANAIDMENGVEAGLTPAMLDRLKLDEGRIGAMAGGIRAIAGLKDPVGEIMAEWDRPNGLHIERVRTPLGVIGVVYESRPNVTADAGALCLKAGNAVILRGGSDSVNSSAAIHACLVRGLEAAGLPADAIQRVPVTDRAAVGELLTGLDGNVDVIVPRGGKSLVARVQADARVPVFAHLEGICHVYVDASADLSMAVSIVLNAKMRRTGICGSAETLLVDSAIADTVLPKLAEALKEAGCELRGDERARAIVADMKPATEEDWATEYLAPILAVAVVDGIDGALAHISRWSSGHTEVVITEDQAVADKFFADVDSAILLHNASSQFADGGEFGMGAEIGIATGRIHARGPVGAEQLTTYKYLVRGKGQVRP